MPKNSLASLDNETLQRIYSILYSLSPDGEDEDALREDRLLPLYIKVIEDEGQPPFSADLSLDAETANEIVRYAAYLVGELATPDDQEAIAVLTNTLSHEQDRVKVGAATALGKLKAESAVEPLLRVFDDMTEQNDLGGIMRLAQTLGQIGDHRSRGRLQQFITERQNDPNSQTQFVLAQARSALESINQTIQQSGRTPPITLVGTTLQQNGATFRFFGTNAYYLMKEAAFAGLGINPTATVPTQIREFFAIAQISGLKVVRVWGFHEHQAFDQGANTQRQPGTTGGHFQLVPGPGLNALEWVINEAARCGIYLIITLADYWNWEGGIRQYAHWADNTIPVPGNSSSQRQHPDRAVEEIFYTGRRNGNPLPLDPRQLYRDYACHVIGRFHNKPNILAWELMNEPRAKHISINNLIDWIRDTAQHIRNTCNPSPQLLSIGGVEMSDLPQIFQQLPPQLIDLADTHLYPDPTHQNLSPTQAEVELGNVANFAINTLQKPFYLGEFGIGHNVGRARHQEYQRWSNILQSLGTSGLLFWQLLPQSRTAYDTNEIHVALNPVSSIPGPVPPQPLRSVGGNRDDSALPGSQMLVPDANQVVDFANNALNTW